MANIKIKDLDVDLAQLMKKDPQILSKIRGGVYSGIEMKSKSGKGGRGGSSGSAASGPSAGPDTMFCCTGYDSGCAPGKDTMFCCTGDDTGCHPFSY